MGRHRWALFGSLLLGAPCLQGAGAKPGDVDGVRLRAAAVALQNVRVFDGTGAPARDGQTVLIRGSRIEAVGDAPNVPVPPDAERLDLSGHTVLPGLVMLHEHLMATSPEG